MPLSLASYGDLWKLADELKKPFQRRDSKWADRRRIRYRRMETQLRSLPLNPQVSDQALMVYQTEVPNQEIHKRVKRLIANRPKFEIIVYDNDPEIQRLGQALEEGYKATFKWMNRGKISFDWRITEFQQGDGVGVAKLSFVPGHGDVLGFYENDRIVEGDEDVDEDDIGDNDRSARIGRNEARTQYRSALARHQEAKSKDSESLAYDEVTDKALRTELPPFRLEAVDPLSCYWWEDEDGIEVMAEMGTKSLHPLLSAFADYGLQLSEDKSRLIVSGSGGDALSARTAPDSTFARDFGQRVSYVEIRTRDEIAILIEHPKIKNRRPKKSDRGVVLRFDNPFGPYTTGYALVPGDITTEENEEDKYQPPALAALNGAQVVNVLTTARVSAAISNALAPTYVKVAPDAAPSSLADEDKTPDIKEGQEIPMIPGEVRRVDAPNIDLDKADARILADMEESKFRDVLEGGAASEATGHRLAIQVAQADIQLVPYQNARKEAIEELMKGVLYAVRRHGLTIYIPTIPDGARTGTEVRVAEPARLSPEMADLNFELVVRLGAETPVTKYAKWQALEQREEAGTLGYQTLIEESDIENPEDEIARIVEGKMFKGFIDQAVPLFARLIFTAVAEKVFPNANQPSSAPVSQTGIPPDTGRAQGGGQSDPNAPENVVRLPGVNHPITQRSSEGGPSVPESVELGSSGR